MKKDVSLHLTVSEVNTLISMMNGLRTAGLINDNTFVPAESKAVYYKIQAVLEGNEYYLSVGNG